MIPNLEHKICSEKNVYTQDKDCIYPSTHHKKFSPDLSFEKWKVSLKSHTQQNCISYQWYHIWSIKSLHRKMYMHRTNTVFTPPPTHTHTWQEFFPWFVIWKMKSPLIVIYTAKCVLCRYFPENYSCRELPCICTNTIIAYKSKHCQKLTSVSC
jgi:hypothetical protein